MRHRGTLALQNPVLTRVLTTGGRRSVGASRVFVFLDAALDESPILDEFVSRGIRLPSRRNSWYNFGK